MRGSANTTINVNVPSNIAGDVMYIGWVSDGDGDVGTPPAGFTAVTNYDGLVLGSSSGVFYLWSKVSSGSEGSTYTITNTVSERCAVIAFAVRNQASIHSYGTTQVAPVSNSTTATVPAVTTTITGAMRVSIIVCNVAVAPVATLYGHTVLGTANQPSGGTVDVQYKALPTATTDASATASLSAGGPWKGIAFTIAPTTSSGGGGIELTANAAATTATSTPVLDANRALTASGAATSDRRQRLEHYTCALLEPSQARQSRPTPAC